MAKIDRLLERVKEHLDEGEQPLQTVLGAYEMPWCTTPLRAESLP